MLGFLSSGVNLDMAWRPYGVLRIKPRSGMAKQGPSHCIIFPSCAYLNSCCSIDRPFQAYRIQSSVTTALAPNKISKGEFSVCFPLSKKYPTSGRGWALIYSTSKFFLFPPNYQDFLARLPMLFKAVNKGNLARRTIKSYKKQ